LPALSSCEKKGGGKEGEKGKKEKEIVCAKHLEQGKKKEEEGE